MQKFQELVNELALNNPDEFEQARQEARQWGDKVKSGEIQLDVRELYVDEDGKLKEKDNEQPTTSE